MAEIAFLDFETRSLADLPACGAYAYAKHPSTDVLVLTWAFDGEPVHVWSPNWCWPESTGAAFDRDVLPLLSHLNKGGYVVAWNAFFDRHIWNDVANRLYGWGRVPVNQWLCAMAQAEGNNLPGKLEKACEALGLPRKDDAGTRLIAQLCTGTREDWSETLHDKLGRFRAYGAKDTEVMRNVWRSCRPLTLLEWGEYHASEVINDRGVAVDAEFAAAATRYANAETDDLNAELLALTGDARLTVTNHVRKAAWLKAELWPAPELQALMARPATAKSEAAGKERLSADRSTRETVLGALGQPDFAALFTDAQLGRVVRFLEILEAGNSAAVRKFIAIARQGIVENGTWRIHGQYSFNGAGQTGRFSSRGTQIHNLIRLPLDAADPDRAIDAMEDILAGASAESLAEVYELPIARLLARLIRPTFIAPPGKVLVWGDWDQIEARVLPWLSGSVGGEAKLELFRQKQDVYKHAAAPIFDVAPDAVTKEQRQIGKVSELALGFGGSVGAFASMGRNYGVILPEARVLDIVTRWRAANSWARHFWDALWQAAMAAWADPGVWYHAGRVQYLFHPTLMRGTLICALPDGRWLVYPQLRRDRYEDEHGVTRTRVSYLKGFSGGAARVGLWYGVLAENATQATAAIFLRRALARLVDCAVLHTHDEVVIEVALAAQQSAESRLTEDLLDLPDWATGLPLSVTLDSGPYYFHR